MQSSMGTSLQRRVALCFESRFIHTFIHLFHDSKKYIFLCCHTRCWRPGKAIIARIKEVLGGREKSTRIVSHRPLSPCLTGLLAAAFFLLPKNNDSSFLLLLLMLLRQPCGHFVYQKVYTNSEPREFRGNFIRHRTRHIKQILVGPGGQALLPLPVHTIQGPYQMSHWAVNVYPSRGDTLHNGGTGCREHYREHTTTSALH